MFKLPSLDSQNMAELDGNTGRPGIAHERDDELQLVIRGTSTSVFTSVDSDHLVELDVERLRNPGALAELKDNDEIAPPPREDMWRVRRLAGEDEVTMRVASVSVVVCSLTLEELPKCGNLE